MYCWILVIKLGIFLDFAKAFDTVDQKVLLNILSSFGINNQSLNWFLSYLKDRTRIVRYILGNELGINRGVPQWSDSGPILFIMYINSICDLKIDGSITTYVKDICLVYSNISWASVYTKASTALKKIIKKLHYILTFVIFHLLKLKSLIIYTTLIVA